jgi:tetratricopeptide (TPR) repeat protein
VKTSAAVAVCVLCAAAAESMRAAPGPTEASRIAAVYDLILDARFDQAEARIKETCPPAPMPACRSLAVASLWWQILVDPDVTTLDDRFARSAADAIAAAEDWTRREPRRGEAWFYLGVTRGPLVNWRALRGQRIPAAREAGKIKDALERALMLDPSLDDAYFGIGLYHYYADVLPAYARLLRWLLLLPGGDRKAGLAEMLRAREHAVILRGEADFQLHQVYLWYERRPDEAIALLESLDARYPYNPVFLERIAEARSKQFRDRAASAAAWRRLLDRARAGRVYDAARVARRAEDKTRTADR